MTPEDPPLPPDCELDLLKLQPKRTNPVFRGCMVATILFVLLILTAPFTLRARKKAPHTEATSNARQIGLALFDFEQKYGSFPSAVTAADLNTSNPTHTFNLTGTSSNALFRQIFAADITQSEAIFYAKAQGCRKPDGDITSGEALKKGELSFAYISGLSTNGNPAKIIAFAPIIPGTTKFDQKTFHGKAVVLKMDGSVSSVPIAKDGHIYDRPGSAGIDLLSPTHPIWDGKPFKIHYPE